MSNFTRSLLLICLVLTSAVAYGQPVANFTATPLVGCAPLVVQFTSTSTGNPTSYQWNLGNGTTPVLQNPSTTYTLPGTYTVSLKVTNASGTNTKTVTSYITVYGAPIVNFSANDTAGCPPHPVIFSDASNPVTPGAATYSWNFGDGYTGNTQNPSHTYLAPGYYNTTLIVTNSGGCVSTLTKPNYIHVYNPPVADFTAPTTHCDNPATVSFTSNITGTGPYTYSWDFGDGGTSFGANPSHVYVNAGSYNVNLVVTDANGCKDTIFKPAYITVNSLAAAFPIPGSGCVNTPFTFTTTTTGAQTYFWRFGDGGTLNATTPSVSHVYTTAGTYNVTLIVGSGACLDSVTHPITIWPQPDANFNFTPAQPCPAPSVIVFNNNSSGANSYAWTFGDGGTASNNNPTHTYNTNGLFDVTLIATNSHGCKDTLIKPLNVKIYDLDLEIGALPAQGCAPLPVFFGSATFTNIPFNGAAYPYATATWFWDFGDGFTSTQDTVTHIYSNPGTYTVTCTITTVNGCTAVETMEVHVGPHPVPFFTMAPLVICNHESVQFTNGSTNATVYVWDFGDAGSSSSTHPSHTYASSGTFTVTLHAYNNGCEDTYTAPVDITVHPPTSLWNAAYNCDTPMKVFFDDATTIGATSRLWWFGDGNTSTAISPSHTYAALGTYNVSLITYNSTYGCTDTLTKQVTLVDPHVSFTANDTAVCMNDTVHFTSSYTGTGSQYDWTVNNFWFQDTTANFDFTFDTPGLYTVRLCVRDILGCWDTLIKTNYVIVGKPDAQFTASPTLGCVPMLVNFTDQSTDVPGATISSRYWTFGTGATATTASASTSYTYLTAGVFDVQLIVTDIIGCKDTLLKPAYIEARKPVAAFYANDTLACIGQNLVFTNTSTGSFLTAFWDFGDGTTSAGFSPTHSYAQTGNYTVKLVVTDPSGCKDSLTRVAYINISKPDAGFTMSDTMAICPPLTVFFTNTSTGALSYAWSLGNSNSSIQNPTGTYTDPGIYSIMLVATSNQGCTDTAYGQANVLGYAGGLSYTPLLGCAPLSVDFIATLTNVPSVVWDFSDGTTVPANGSSTITHVYQTPGAYVPKLILSNGAGCLNSSQGIDTIKVDGVYAGFTSTPVCEKTLVQFTDTSFSFFSAVSSVFWDFNNGQQTSNSSNPTYFFNTAGTYPIKLIVTNANGCADTFTENLVVHPLPVINAGADTSICSGDEATLAATGGVSYVWQPAGSLSCSACPDPVATPSAPTAYVVEGTDINGCVRKDTVAVSIQFVTTSAVADGGEICQDSVFQLLAYGAHHYEWKPAESLNNSTIANPLASPQVTTTYTVTAWEGSCPPDSHTVKVVVYPKPVVDAGGDQTIVAGNSVMLNATGSNITKFLWSPVSTLSCDICSNPVASPMVTTTYKITVTSSRGCRNFDTVTVHVLCDQSQLFIPNLFSPNGDGQNDVFFPRGGGLQSIKTFRIYNRWGEAVFERRNIGLNDEQNGWDGTYKGAKLGPDVFVYVIEGVCDSGEPINWKGDITLVR